MVDLYHVAISVVPAALRHRDDTRAGRIDRFAISSLNVDAKVDGAISVPGNDMRTGGPAEATCDGATAANIAFDLTRSRICASSFGRQVLRPVSQFARAPGDHHDATGLHFWV